MKSTAIACAIGAILVSFGPATFAQGFERGGDDQQRFEQRDQRWHADAPSWDAPARGDGGWRHHAADQRFERRAPRHEDQARDAGWRDGRGQLLLVQEQRDEQPARGPLTVIVQVPATPAVAVVGGAGRTIIRPHSGHAVARLMRPVARRTVVAKAAACAAPGAAVAVKPRVAGRA